MNTVPRSLRLQIAIFGRTNVGKSSLINLLCGQAAAITSPIPGTTTDIVEKNMEFAPLGPVVLIDTAGLDDQTELGELRIQKTLSVFDRAHIAVMVVRPGEWGETEQEIIAAGQRHKIQVIAAINQIDGMPVTADFLNTVKKSVVQTIIGNFINAAAREKLIADFRSALLKTLPESFINTPPLLQDLIAPGSLVTMVVPIDLQAPRGRLIMPQVQTIRDVLDANAMTLVVKENQYPEVIRHLTPQPALIVCDSQVVKLVTDNTPENIPCTTFSILFSRLKGNTKSFMAGCRTIKNLQDNDLILVAEACTHHPTCEDIGRVKIPAMLQKVTGKKLRFEFAPGRDYPQDITKYSLIIHCGSCMLNRQETLWRITQAEAAGIPITNYGMAISWCQGVLENILIPE